MLDKPKNDGDASCLKKNSIRFLGLKAGLPFLMIFLSVATGFGQQAEANALRFTGYLQSLAEFHDGNAEIRLGKAEFGFWARYEDLAGIRFAFKVSSDFTVMPFDAYVFLIPLKGFELRLGQFRNPFLLENITVPYKRDMIEEPQCSSYLSTRDVGFGLFWTSPKLEISVASLSGTGLNTRDDNTAKDVVARLAYRPTTELLVGGSGYWGKSGPDERLEDRTLYDLQFRFEKPFQYKLVSEYVSRKQPGNDRNSLYLTAGVFPPLKIGKTGKTEVLLRYDREREKDVPADNRKLTLGLNYYLLEDYTFRIQLNYVRSRRSMEGSDHKAILGFFYSFN